MNWWYLAGAVYYVSGVTGAIALCREIEGRVTYSDLVPCFLAGGFYGPFLWVMLIPSTEVKWLRK